FMTDGLYVYMIPPSSSGDGLIRVDLANYGTVEVLSASGRGLNQVGWSEAGFMDDYYGYLPPQHDESLVVRFDQATFQEFLTLDISQAPRAVQHVFGEQCPVCGNQPMRHARSLGVA
ncbi:unnamed protein product, partial [Durusdinium trenchii]